MPTHIIYLSLNLRIQSGLLTYKITWYSGSQIPDNLEITLGEIRLDAQDEDADAADGNNTHMYDSGSDESICSDSIVDLKYQIM